MSFGSSQRFVAISRFDYLISIIRQNGRHQASHRLLVLHNQERSAARKPHSRGSFRRFLNRTRINCGEVKFERASNSRLAPNVNPAAALPHDAVDRGQPKSCSLVLLFGREERLKNVLADRLVHSSSVVLYHHHHVTPRFRVLLHGCFIVANIHIHCADPEYAAVWHCVTSVYHELNHYLIDLLRVCHDPPQQRVERSHNFDVLTNQPPEHPFGVLDDIIQIQRPWSNSLLPAKRQQLLRQASGAFRRLPYFLNVLPKGISGAGASEKEFAMSHDDRQKVIEVVCYSTGQSPDTLKLLCLSKLILKLNSLSNVYGSGNRAEITFDFNQVR